MPDYLRKIFEREYGKNKGNKIFYSWLNKKKKKKGSIMLTIISVLAFFMFGILIIGLLFPDISIARSPDNLDCSNISISDGNKISCIIVDTVVPLWIVGLLMIGGGYIIYKIV